MGNWLKSKHSNCCEAEDKQITINGPDFSDVGICPNCKEHCEFELPSLNFRRAYKSREKISLYKEFVYMKVEENKEEQNTVQKRTVFVMPDGGGEVRLDHMSVDQLLREIKSQKERIETTEKHELTEVPVIQARLDNYKSNIASFVKELHSRS